MGADDYITKPFEDIELLNAIEIRLKKAAVLETKYAPSQEGINEFIKDVKSSGLISQLADQYDVETYSKKQTLYQESKRPRYLYYLVKGKVKGFKTHEDGKEYITDLFSVGDFMGYPAIIEDKNYDDSAVVMEEAEIMQIPKEDFLQMIYGNMDVAAKFIRIITQNVKEKEERLLSLAYSSLRKRVAKALIDIQAKFNAAHPNKPLEISREDFAHYVGTATESLIRTLSDFKSEKLIAIKEGKISIINAEKLANLLY
jgi:CRP-like cAMP-binding protein